MLQRSIWTLFLFVVLGWVSTAISSASQVLPSDSSSFDDAKVEFFENRIRPVLASNCYECHNSSGTAEGGLALDHRRAIEMGGDSGPVVVPGRPRDSLLFKSIRHEIEGLQMPEDGAKLEPAVLADFEKWIRDGAVDPRDNPPTPAELSQSTSWETKFEERKKWWCFLPIEAQQIPKNVSTEWRRNPIDAFVVDKLKQNKLVPNNAATPNQLVRRLYFVLTGLPPTPKQASQWTRRIKDASTSDQPSVIEQLVDELLDSPHFGERWARHWMDWIRYAESHGSEGDPEIVNAWQYRDYLIRAMNDDVPLDQLIREHVAGDLLKDPRINTTLKINESIIGTAHWRMVFHGFAPTDALDEKVRFVDDQINTFTKAFLGLTVSCARCHDHKFDAISQADYYALFGTLASCRPGRKAIELPEHLGLHRERLSLLKNKIRLSLADEWTQQATRIESKLSKLRPGKNRNLNSITSLFFEIRDLGKNQKFDSAWLTQVQKLIPTQSVEPKHTVSSTDGTKRWNLGDITDQNQWFMEGEGLKTQPFVKNNFAVSLSGPDILLGIYPSGVYSHSISTKHGARLSSRDLTLGDDMEVWCQTIGHGGATLRYVVQDYPRNGTVYPVTGLSDQWQWRRFDLAYWAGDQIHLELATAADAPLLAKPQARSWFGIREVVVAPKGRFKPPQKNLVLAKLIHEDSKSPPGSEKELVQRTQKLIVNAIDSWRAGNSSDDEKILLNECLQLGLISNRLAELKKLQPLIHEYRELEAEIPVATRVPSLDESVGTDFPLLTRGDHNQPAETIPRRFLQAIDGQNFQTQDSGRKLLAQKLLSRSNPLTRRVMANRIWHHVFGQGIVATPDNFGKLGARPSHPRLLDWLALQLEQDDWSLKKTVKRMVLSRTWQQSSNQNSIDSDAQNRFCHEQTSVDLKQKC